MTTTQKHNHLYERKVHSQGPSKIEQHGRAMFYRSTVAGFSYEVTTGKTPDQTFDDTFAAFERAKANPNLKNRKHILATLARKLEVMERIITTS